MNEIICCSQAFSIFGLHLDAVFEYERLFSLYLLTFCWAGLQFLSISEGRYIYSRISLFLDAASCE